MLALLVVASVVGAFVGRRGEGRGEDGRDERPDSDDREDGSTG
jgi:hypothetical protein